MQFSNTFWCIIYYFSICSNIMTEIIMVWQPGQHFRSTSSKKNRQKIRRKKISFGFRVRFSADIFKLFKHLLHPVDNVVVAENDLEAFDSSFNLIYIYNVLSFTCFWEFWRNSWRIETGCIGRRRSTPNRVIFIFFLYYLNSGLNIQCFKFLPEIR